MDNLTNNAQSIITLEQIEWMQFVKSKLPVTVFLSLFSVVGTIGNLHAIIVYSLRYKPSNHRVFVVWLAVVDLIGCCISIPFEIFDIRFDITFSRNADIVCKIFRYLAHFVSICSVFLLGVIAVERYRKVCQPFGRQLTPKNSQIACIVTVITSVLLSIPALLTYGVVDQPVTDYFGLNSTNCNTEMSPQNKFLYKIFNYVLLVLCIVVFVVCIVAYSIIGKTLLRQYKFKAKNQSNGKASQDFSAVKEQTNDSFSAENISNGSHFQSRNSFEVKRSSDTESSKVIEMTTTSPKRGESKKNRKPRLDRSKQITLMFLVATAISILGYAIYLTFAILWAVDSVLYKSIENVLGSVLDICIRLFFINNVINPIVYCFIDVRFRTNCKIFYRNIFYRCYDKTKIMKNSHTIFN